MKFLLFVGVVVQGININIADSFDESLGQLDNPLMRGPDRGYDEANDYDREIERPENVKFDDESWNGFAKSFNQMETENFTLDLNEKELIG